MSTGALVGPVLAAVVEGSRFVIMKVKMKEVYDGLVRDGFNSCNGSSD